MFLTSAGVEDPNFFTGLDAWEKEDDRQVKGIAKLLFDQTGESVEPKLAD